MSVERQERARQDFVALSARYAPRLPDLLRKRVTGLLSGGSFGLDVSHKEQVAFGLNALFNRGPYEGFAYSDLCCFFMEFLCIVWAEANDDQRGKLASRLYGCLNDSNKGLTPIFCELATAFIYLQK